MDHRLVALGLSNHQRRFLITLIDGPVPFVAAVGGGAKSLQNALFRMLLIRRCNEGGHWGDKKFMCLTENGRHVVCYVLAEYAEALIKADIARFDLHYSLTPVANYRLHVEHTRELVPA